MSGAGNGMEQAVTSVFRVVFSLLFPLALLLSCVAAVILTVAGYTQFAFLAGLGLWLVEAAKGHQVWAEFVLLGLVFGSLPLARVAYRELAIVPSNAIGSWVAVVLSALFTGWLAKVWPPEQSVFQAIVFAFLLFGIVGTLCEAVIGTLKLLELNRPKRGPEVVEAQKAHGDARLASEDEAVSFLNSKR